MTGAGQSLRDFCTLNDVGGPFRHTFSSGGDENVSEATPACQMSPRANLQLILCVGSRNILSSSEDHQMPHLSDELSSLRMDIIGLSEARMPGIDEISNRGFTYYWSGMSNGARLKGVAIGISSRLQPSVSALNERIMRLRMKHTLGFLSCCRVRSYRDVRDTLIVLGDFNAATCTERAGYEYCSGSHFSGTRNINSSLLLNFVKSRWLRIAGSWYQRPEQHRWTWIVKEIDHILVNTR